MMIPMIGILTLGLMLLLGHQSGLVNSQLHSEDKKSLKDKCVILLWTKWFGIDYLDRLKRWKALDCLESDNCIATQDRSHLSQARAIVFHLRDVKADDIPVEHLDGQFWVLVNHEAPYNTMNDTREFKMIEKQINWTISYRSDSDIYVPYGKIIEREVDDVWPQRVSFEGKSKMVGWMVSNCKAPSGRLEYAHELQKYVDVEIYGKCGPFDCPREKGDWCFDMLAETYKFYLSFENTVSYEFLRFAT
jgi:hypothetical protein